MSASEAQIKKRIMTKSRGVPGLLLRMRPPGSSTGDPDITGCYHGRHIELEVKRPAGRGATPLQQYRLEQWRAAGAACAVVRSWEDVQDFLRIIED